MIYGVLKEVIPFKYLPFPPIWSFANWPAPAVHNWWIRPMHWFSCNYLLGHFLIYQFPEQLLRVVTGALQVTAREGGENPEMTRTHCLSKVQVLGFFAFLITQVTPEMTSACQPQLAPLLTFYILPLLLFSLTFYPLEIKSGKEEQNYKRRDARQQESWQERAPL